MYISNKTFYLKYSQITVQLRKIFTLRIFKKQKDLHVNQSIIMGINQLRLLLEVNYVIDYLRI